ncbi:MAG TPA: DUF4440 domain-containing protein [Acidobacteriaceae bacterium]|jgi:hypothetical protein
MRAKIIATLLFVNLAALGISGCLTVWGAKDPPTLASTSSAEQYERILWTKTREKKWSAITPLFAANVVYAVRGRVLSRDQIVSYLQSEQIRDFVLADLIVKPNGPDMTVSYTLQLSGSDGKTQSLVAVSVWQQVRKGWILTAHTEQPRNESTGMKQ